MTPGAKAAILSSRFNPYNQPYNAAVYSLFGNPSDQTYLVDGSNNQLLIADQSGNSATNAIVCNGGTSAAVTTPTKTVTGSQTFSCQLELSTFTPAGNVTLASKKSGNNGFEWLLLTTGVMRLTIGDGSALTNYDSTTSMSAAANTLRTLTAAYTDGGSGNIVFSVDGVQLGTTVSTTKTLTNAATSLTIGMANTIGKVYRVQVGSVYDCNPVGAAKLAATFTSGGDTYTVTAGSADLGARISGARDLVQLTAANQPVVSRGTDRRNLATFDGVNDYLKAAPFALTQPTTYYFVGAQITWASNATLVDGNTVNSGFLRQYNVTPDINTYAGSFVGENSGWGLNTRAVVSAVFNGASSLNGINLKTALTGDAGASNMNGLTLGARGDIGAGWTNMAFCALIVRSVADSPDTRRKFITALARQWNAVLP